MTKQNITFLKIQKFIRHYPSILFFQHNNLSVSHWFRLRTELKTMENVNVLLLKNTLVNHVFAQDNVTTPSLFQGPCFALGFSNSSQFSDIVKITQQEPTIVLTGALFDNQFLNHLDISKFLELDNRVHDIFLANLNQGKNLNKILIDSLTNPVNLVDQVALNLLQCLESFKTQTSKRLIVYI